MKTASPSRFSVGTLTYTRMGLVGLFFWLLWGDFIFMLLENVCPSLLPLLLKQHGATNAEIALIVGSATSVLNSIITPVVSFKSDRYRSRFGRRIPFLFWPTPFIVLFLGAIPFAPEIHRWLIQYTWIEAALNCSPMAPVILLIGLFTVGFQMFNMVVASVYYYLFKDVVPEHYMGRFISLFRVFVTLSSFVWSYFIYGTAETHTREIFVGIALLYGVGFGLMCWRVKEGEYPPPPPQEKGPGLVGGVKTYFTECFKEPIYLWFYASRACGAIGAASGMFAVFFLRDELSLSLDFQGKMNAWPTLACLPLAYPIGVLIDRWKAIRVLLGLSALLVGVTAACFFFVNGKASWVTSLWTWQMIGFPAQIAMSTMVQTLLPRDRFGQISSAMAMVSAVAGIVAAPLCGLFLDWVGVYRYYYLWSATFSLLSLVCLFMVYRYWITYGGPDNYQAPL